MSVEPAAPRRRPKDRRDQILNVAADLFADRGFAAVSMQDIGEGTGITGGAIYRHFPSKDALLQALVLDIISLWERIAEHTSEDAIARGENMLRAAMDKKRRDGVAHAHFAQLNGLGLPFADDTFDAVTSFKFFHLVPNETKRAFIEEMARVTKPGGKIVIEFNSPYYGGALAFYRYYFRKRKPGGMRQKCLFPDQVPTLFEGLNVRRRLGVKLPFAGALSRVLGRRAVAAVNRIVGSIPGVRYVAYAILIEAEKPARRGPVTRN